MESLGRSSSQICDEHVPKPEPPEEPLGRRARDCLGVRVFRGFINWALNRGFPGLGFGVMEPMGLVLY